MKLFKSDQLIPGALIWFFVFLCGHWVVISVLPESKRLPDRGPIAAAQKFILKPESPELVIAGSSFADRLDPFNQAAGTEMITINGGSAFDGLLMVKERSQSFPAPSRIAIEVNRLIVLEEKDWVTEIFKRPYSAMWKKVPVLRDANRPVAIIGWPTHTAMNKLTMAVASKILNPPSHALEGSESSEAENQRLERNLKEQAEYLSTPVSDEHLEAICGKLEEYLKYFEEAGTRVALFRMPIHPSLEVLDTPARLSSLLKARFPDSEYLWIPDVDSSQYQYTDGIHLDPPSAQMYLNHLLESFPPGGMK